VAAVRSSRSAVALVLAAGVALAAWLLATWNRLTARRRGRFGDSRRLRP
jgi:hypothetical protein